MKNLTYSQYSTLLQKVKGNPYLYVSTYTEAKRNLIPEQFNLFQQEINNIAV
ncbi:hypothetical protein [Wenyingzhuangia sp. 2_MG-2023]|uniref:hypothetical protein n=1 Tax=Wenyingzhuangia sp. 2_MG-2023 TaxID=3062639 RepID=UPI0026E38A2C|nr:hypothetical protein [Wenyingzhuangia sp. 2_MG-2023]MDO6738204.1 hypothetical protein [Wenyingzhuangia sp. 2_MG-2023]MDO6801472.1 hypothetical protein [Wenyingzhuangia sp. 1_MG-2023]